MLNGGSAAANGTVRTFACTTQPHKYDYGHRAEPTVRRVSISNLGSNFSLCRSRRAGAAVGWSDESAAAVQYDAIGI